MGRPRKYPPREPPPEKAVCQAYTHKVVKSTMHTLVISSANGYLSQPTLPVILQICNTCATIMGWLVAQLTDRAKKDGGWQFSTSHNTKG